MGPSKASAEAETVVIRKRLVQNEMPEVLVQLCRNRILGGIVPQELRAMLDGSLVASVPERETLFHQGDHGRSVLVVLSGFVKLSLMAAGREVVLEICGADSMFGELAVLNDWPRRADAVALANSEVLSIDGPAFQSTLVRAPDAMFALLGVMSRRLRNATELLIDGASLPGPARLAKALCQLVGAYGWPELAGLKLDVSLSQRELGGMTGLSRESINKQLASWRDCGWIELPPRHIVVCAVGALRDLIDDAVAA